MPQPHYHIRSDNGYEAVNAETPGRHYDYEIPGAVWWNRGRAAREAQAYRQAHPHARYEVTKCAEPDCQPKGS